MRPHGNLEGTSNLLANQKNLIQSIGSLEAMDPSAKDKVKHDLEGQLMHCLAAYVLLRRRDPVCALLEDLLHLEAEAGEFLGHAISDVELQSRTKGALASVLSYIPFSGAPVKPTTKKEQE